jgi:serine/threonine protein kinase
VMRLLDGMKPFSSFEMDGKTRKELEDSNRKLPGWLAGIPDKDMAFRLYYYADTGSTRRRLAALAKCASILARLHGAGLVYGDISTNNAFVGEGSSGEVWLIDADNLRFEVPKGGASVWTPGFGAPEIVKGTDCSRPSTDCWAFAVMAFKILSLCHPFIGRAVLEPENDGGGWDADPVEDGTPSSPDDQAYAGYLPFIDDETDDSNRGLGGLPRELVATPKLRLLFQETFGAGKTQPHRRPGLGFWALELDKAFDLSLECDGCKMSYFAYDHKKCPYCQVPRPKFVRARTQRWEILIPRDATEFSLPHRLFHPFSLQHHEDAAYEMVPDFLEKAVYPVRGTKPFPDNLSFEFVDEAL